MMGDDADKRVGASGVDYEVGYGKPPAATRFQKGQSGNPKGRPKGVKNLSTMLDEELEQRVVVKENGRQKKITKRRATMKQLVNRAASGEHRALQLLINYLEEREKRADASPEVAQLGEVEQEILSGVIERLRNSQPDNGEE
jgi:uncharacterized protein DUF5681